MSFDPVSAIFELGKSAVERIWPDPIRRAEEMRKLEELRAKGDSEELNAQSEVMLGVVSGLRTLVEGAGTSQSRGQTTRQTVSSPSRATKAIRRPALAAPKTSAKKNPNEVIPMDDDDFEDF